MGSVIPKEEVRASRVFSFEDFERKARQVIARARAEGHQIVVAAEARARETERRIQAEAEVRVEEARVAGFEQGRREGQEQARHEAHEAAVADARSEVANVVRALNAGLAEVEREKRGALALAESGLIELAVAVARRVCKITAIASPEPARANARALLELVAHYDDVEIRLNPADVELLPQIAAELLQYISGLEHVTIQADPGVDRGGCVLRTRDGVVDATVARQLDRIAEAICLPRENAADGRFDAHPPGRGDP